MCVCVSECVFMLWYVYVFVRERERIYLIIGPLPTCSNTLPTTTQVSGELSLSLSLCVCVVVMSNASFICGVCATTTSDKTSTHEQQQHQTKKRLTHTAKLASWVSEAKCLVRDDFSDSSLLQGKHRHLPGLGARAGSSCFFSSSHSSSGSCNTRA